MATFCSAGDTANVQLSTGETLSFEDTPVDIQYDEQPDKLEYNTTAIGNYRVNYQFYYWQHGTPLASKQLYLRNINVGGNVGGIRGTMSPGGYYQELFGYNNNVEIFATRQYSNAPPEWIEVNGYAGFVNTTEWRINSIQDLGTQQFLTPILIPGTKKLIVKAFDGGILYEKDYTNSPKPDYTVNCTKCPPGTLDCGDCCLPCDEIFNQISEIRALLARLN